MRRRWIVPTLSLVGVGVLALQLPAQAGGRPTAGRPLLQADHCSLSPAEGPVAAGGNVTVSVPGSAMLRTDRGGHVVAAATNTGCAPRPSDDIVLLRPDGTVDPAPAAAAANRRWFGDFTTPGVFAPQPGG